MRDVCGLGRQDAGAALDALLGMAVRVVPEHEGHGDPRAVDRPVFGVGDGHIERDVVAEGERPALGRRRHRDRRGRVAGDDLDSRRGLVARRVRDGQRRRVRRLGFVAGVW